MSDKLTYLLRQTMDLKILSEKGECIGICNEKLDLRWQKEWREEHKDNSSHLLKESCRCC